MWLVSRPPPLPNPHYMISEHTSTQRTHSDIHLSMLYLFLLVSYSLYPGELPLFMPRISLSLTLQFFPFLFDTLTVSSTSTHTSEDPQVYRLPPHILSLWSVTRARRSTTHSVSLCYRRPTATRRRTRPCSHAACTHCWSPPSPALAEAETATRRAPSSSRVAQITGPPKWPARSRASYPRSKWDTCRRGSCRTCTPPGACSLGVSTGWAGSCPRRGDRRCWLKGFCRWVYLRRWFKGFFKVWGRKLRWSSCHRCTDVSRT